MTPEEIINGIIESEGEEYTNDPQDRGGPTKYGITLKTLQRVRAPLLIMASHVEALTREQAALIYLGDYFIKPGFSHLTYGPLQAYVTDCGVLHGRTRATKWLQSLVPELKCDGLLGPVSIEAVNLQHGKTLFLKLIGTRVIKLAEFVQDVPGQVLYIEGWMRRATKPLFE